jgi:DNA modification methylase
MQLDALPQPERVEIVDPETLTTDGDNPNEQSDEMFGLLCENMRQKGWLGNHIVADTDGLIADGEHRWRAAQEIGLEEVPVKFYDIDDAERRLWRQELNKISGDHDTKRDALEYDYLLNSGKSDAVNDLVSATDEDLDELLAEIKVDNSLPPQYEYDPEHNVYFEDCVEGMRERLDDDSVDCVITDPPYGIDYKEGGNLGSKDTFDFNDIQNDGVEDALELFDTVAGELNRVLKNDGHLFAFASWKTEGAFIEILERNGFDVRSRGIWVKDGVNNLSQMGNKDNARFSPKHESLLFAVQANHDPRNFADYRSDVFEYGKPKGGAKNPHPTQKPVDFITELIDLSTEVGHNVIDPFMGSGTTAVAAIQNDRDYVGFELDEDNYRSVIERRIGEAKRQVTANQD